MVDEPPDQPKPTIVVKRAVLIKNQQLSTIIMFQHIHTFLYYTLETDMLIVWINIHSNFLSFKRLFCTISNSQMQN